VLAALAAVTTLAEGARAETVVQVQLPGLLMGRSVSTLMGDQIVPWTLPTDGGNLQNAFVTQAVAMKQGKPTANALPNDGHFAANARHPEVVLNYSNTADSTAPQTMLVALSTTFSFVVPQATYSKLFLFFNGAAGGAGIMVTLKYTDGMETKAATVPDYYADIPPNDPVLFNLATDLAKYDKNSQVSEANHHNITGVELSPQAGKTLTEVQVARDDKGNLVFWGATGIATSDVAVGGAGGAGGGGGMAGGGGAGGAGGVGGAGGASGGGAGGAVTAGGGGAGGAVGGAPAGGTPGTAGVSAGGGTGGAPAGVGGTGQLPATTPADDGCGCRVGAGSGPAGARSFLALGLLALGLRRRNARIRR
jgi:MYXO-CTERM domain-containing protein